MPYSPTLEVCPFHRQWMTFFADMRLYGCPVLYCGYAISDLDALVKRTD